MTIAPERFSRWLDCNDDDATEAAKLLVSPAEGQFVWHRVATAVNHVAHDDPHLVEPMSAESAAEQHEQLKPQKTANARRDDSGQGSLF